MRLITGLLLLMLAPAVCVYGDDDALRDLGPTANPGEIPKWDGTKWANAHDNITAVNLGPGLSGGMTNGGITVEVSFGGTRTNDQVAAYSDMESTRPPVGAIVAWAKNLSGVMTNLPLGWVECNGQVLDFAGSPLNGVTIPDLNSPVGAGLKGRFLRGATTSGQYEDSDNLTHTHVTPLAVAVADGPTKNNIVGSSDTDANDRNVTTTSSGGSEARPYNYSVVWIIRVK